MMKKIVLLALFIGSIVMASAQGFPSTDSLRNYNTRFTTNSAITWFTNLRGQTLLRGIIDYIDTAKNGAIDTAYKTGDTLYIKTKKPKTYAIYIAPGGGSANTSVGSGYRIAINGTNNVKSVTPGYGVLIDSSTSNQVNFKADTATLYAYVRSVFNSGDTIVTYNQGATGISIARSSNDTIYYKKLVAGTGMTLTLNSDSSVTVTSTVTGGVDTATISSYYFKDGGNNFSAPANIGTNTAQDLRFKVGNVETMRLNQSNGQLLVGTTTPIGGYKMIVGGHFQVNSGFDIWAAGGIRLVGTFFGTSTTGNIFRNTAATSHSTKNIMWNFENSAPTASSGTRQQILMNLYKLINRGTSGFDSTETVLRVDANVTGTATDVRGIWQTYGTNLFNTSFGATYIGYDSLAKNNQYKFNVNGSVRINKDSLPASAISSASFVGIDNTTGQLVKLSNAETTYTPTITNVTNVGTSSISTCYYRRIGDMVDVFGEITIDPTATGDTELRINLPIAAPLGFSYQLSGQATTYDNVQSIRILGDATNDAATFRLNASVDASSHVYSFHIIYYIPGA